MIPARVPSYWAPTRSSDQGDPWLTVQQAAQIAGVHHCTMRRECRAGRLRYARVGGRKLIRIRVSWVDAWLEHTSTPVEVSR
jgi:excisionase family DNA binding protein